MYVYIYTYNRRYKVLHQNGNTKSNTGESIMGDSWFLCVYTGTRFQISYN